MSLTRHYSPLDRLLMRLDHALSSSVAGVAAAQRAALRMSPPAEHLPQRRVGQAR